MPSSNNYIKSKNLTTKLLNLLNTNLRICRMLLAQDRYLQFNSIRIEDQSILTHFLNINSNTMQMVIYSQTRGILKGINKNSINKKAKKIKLPCQRQYRLRTFRILLSILKLKTLTWMIRILTIKRLGQSAKINWTLKI